MTDPQQWVQVVLGDVRVGDSVRTKAGTVPSTSRYADTEGTIVGVRSGSVIVKTGEDTVLYWPNQLERLARPE